MSSPRPVALRVALLAGAATALARWTPIYDPDCFWHLHTGRYVIAHRAIPWIDEFSHTALGRPWRFIDVAADVILYASYRLGGAVGLVGLVAAMGFVAAALSALTQARALGERHGSALVAVAPWVVASLAFRLTPRPQTFTFVALAALLHLVVASRQRPRLLWLAPLITLAWQNLHASGPLAVAVMGAVAVAATLDRRAGTPGRPVALAWLVTLACAAALLGCPHPIDRLTEGFSHVVDPRLSALISEWLPTWTPSAFSPAVVAYAALVALAAIGATQTKDRRPETALLLIAAGVALMGARALRFIPLAALALAPVAAFGARRIIEIPRSPRLALALCAALALGGTATLYGLRKPFGSGVQRAVFPMGAAAFVARTGPQGRLVHDFEMGGYLMFTLGPRYPVFVDGRSWALYDTGFLLDALQLTSERLARLIARYDLRVAILWTEARLARLQREGWTLVYLDDVASVLVRAPDGDPYALRYGYRELHPGRWFEDIERLARDPAALQRADRESQRATAEAPGSSLAWVLRAAVLSAAARAPEADAAAARALRLRPDLTPPHRMMMLRCAARGDRACACAESGAVRARSPRNQQAMDFARRYQCSP